MVTETIGFSNSGLIGTSPGLDVDEVDLILELINRPFASR